MQTFHYRLGEITAGRVPEIRKAIGISDQSMRNWTNDEKVYPKANNIIGLCEFTGTSPNWLLLGKGPRKLSECNFDTKDTNGKIAGRIGPETAKERVMSWIAEQPDEAIGWGGVEHAMMASLKNYEEWLKKRADAGECGTTSGNKSAV
jgi:hypothetical protein